MENNPTYKLIKDFVIINNITLSQVRNATKKQVATMAGIDLSNCTFFEGIKELLIQELEDRARLVILNNFKQKILAEFPQAEFEKGERDGKTFITIWPTGKPAEVIK